MVCFNYWYLFWFATYEPCTVLWKINIFWGFRKSVLFFCAHLSLSLKRVSIRYDLLDKPWLDVACPHYQVSLTNRWTCQANRIMRIRHNLWLPHKFIVRSSRGRTKYTQFCHSISHFQNAFFRLILLKSSNQNELIIKMNSRWNDNRNVHCFMDVLAKQRTKLLIKSEKCTYLVPTRLEQAAVEW